MIKNDTAILQHFVEEWEREIVQYVEKYRDNMTARNILEQRKVGEDVSIDVVQKFDRTGPGAQIVAKGSVPDSMGVKSETVKHDIFQIATGFWLNAKDLKLSPSTKNRLVDISMRDIHRAEDDFALNGNTSLNIKGIVAAAQANSNGKIVASGASGNDTNNKGAWSGETGTDIYDDINTAIGKMDEDFEPAYLLGCREDLLYLNRMDSERKPYYHDIAGLFGAKNEKDKSWIWTSKYISPGKVYLIPKDFLAAELVISENPKIIEYPMSPGQNYWIELAEWVVPEMHQVDAFVEIATT